MVSSLGFARLLKPAPVDGGLELVGLVSCVSTHSSSSKALRVGLGWFHGFSGLNRRCETRMCSNIALCCSCSTNYICSLRTQRHVQANVRRRTSPARGKKMLGYRIHLGPVHTRPNLPPRAQNVTSGASNLCSRLPGLLGFSRAPLKPLGSHPWLVGCGHRMASVDTCPHIQDVFALTVCASRMH